MSMARIDGPVLGIERRTGTAQASGNPFDMTTIRVLVAEQDVSEVTFTTDRAPQVQRGDMVDWLVRLDTYKGAVSCRYVSDYPVLTRA